MRPVALGGAEPRRDCAARAVPSSIVARFSRTDHRRAVAAGVAAFARMIDVGLVRIGCPNGGASPKRCDVAGMRNWIAPRGLKRAARASHAATQSKKARKELHGVRALVDANLTRPTNLADRAVIPKKRCGTTDLEVDERATSPFARSPLVLSPFVRRLWSTPRSSLLPLVSLKSPTLQ
jgi:hypothetical protein